MFQMLQYHYSYMGADLTHTRYKSNEIIHYLVYIVFIYMLISIAC